MLSTSIGKNLLEVQRKEVKTIRVNMKWEPDGSWTRDPRIKRTPFTLWQL